MTPRIAICIPSGRAWDAEMALSLVSIVKESPFETYVLNLMGSQISLQRNELVLRSLALDVTHIFWMDSDMVMPGSTLLELLGHHKDIVGATYLKRIAPFNMLGVIGKGDGRLKPATSMPGGCMLVSADVYKTVKWPWYFEEIVSATLSWQPGSYRSEDYCFSKKAIEAGFNIWCDIQLSQRIAHLGTQSIKMQLREGHPDRWVEEEP